MTKKDTNTKKTFIDAGTCAGWFIDKVIYKKYRSSEIDKIICFEPNKYNYEFLSKKYKDDKRIILFNSALSHKDGMSKFYLKYYDDDLGYIHNPTEEVINSGSSLIKNKINVDPKYFYNIETKKISSVLKELDLENKEIEILKIDVEGSEYDIFLDIMKNDLFKKFRKIYYEDHVRKIPGLRFKKRRFYKNIKKNNIDNIYIQGDHIEYVKLHEDDVIKTINEETIFKACLETLKDFINYNLKSKIKSFIKA